MSTNHTWVRSIRRVGVTCLLASVAAVPLAALTAPSALATSSQLVGVFRIAGGACSSSSISGSYFRMILANGGTNGPYLSNSNSGCPDQTFTPLEPGTDGGLRTATYQSPPSPPFDGAGNARSGTITGPVKFYGTNFATGTNSRDPQTGTSVQAPVIYNNNGALSGDLRAFAVTWNNQYFNQGSPKPNGSYPGNTRALSGSYDASTGRFEIDWTSQIVGGPFNNFTGKWHLEGVFVPAGGSASGTGGTSHSGTTVVGGTTTTRTVTTSAGPSSAATAHASSSASGSATAQATATSSATGTVATTSTVDTAATTTTTRVWSVSWPIVGLAVGLGVLGVAVIVLTGRRKRV